MAVWKSVTADLLDGLSEDDYTFDQSSKRAHLCTKCRTLSSNAPSHPNKSNCDSPSCPGYAATTDSEDDESSDHTPLLLTPLMTGDAMGVAVEHCHSSEPQRTMANQAKKKLLMASGLCLLFIIGEVVGGYLSNSLAIMTDAAHMFSDFASFVISFFAIYLGNRAPRKRYTFGYYRAEALGALFTVMIIWYVTGVLLYLAVHRIRSGEFDVEPNSMMIVAGCAVAFNICLGLLLHGVKLPHGHSHGGGASPHSRLVEEAGNLPHEHNPSDHINIRAALIHVLGDIIQSIGVFISAIIIKVFPDCKVADPICTIIFSVIVFFTTITILRDTIQILMEGLPRSVDYDAVTNDLDAIEGVVKVHDLHIWALTTDRVALTVHLAVNTATTNPETVLQAALKRLRGKFNVYKSTVQVEDYKANVMGSCDQCQKVVL